MQRNLITEVGVSERLASCQDFEETFNWEEIGKVNICGTWMVRNVEGLRPKGRSKERRPAGKTIEGKCSMEIH